MELLLYLVAVPIGWILLAIVFAGSVGFFLLINDIFLKDKEEFNLKNIFLFLFYGLCLYVTFQLIIDY